MKRPKQTRPAPRWRELTLPFDEWLKSAEERLVVPPAPPKIMHWPDGVDMLHGDFQLPIGVFEFTAVRGVLPMRALRHGNNEAWLVQRSRGLHYKDLTQAQVQALAKSKPESNVDPDLRVVVTVVCVLPETADLAVLWSHEVPKLLELVADRNRLVTLARRKWASVRAVIGPR